MLFKKLMVVFFGGMLMIMTLACEREGPAERTGERVDETVEDVGRRTEEAGR
jgi:hypothetical protein